MVSISSLHPLQRYFSTLGIGIVFLVELVVLTTLDEDFCVLLACNNGLFNLQPHMSQTVSFPVAYEPQFGQATFAFLLKYDLV